MELQIKNDIKCDNCDKIAQFVISQKKNWHKIKFHLCKECFHTLYACMGSHLTPTSPRPPYKKVKGEQTGER